MVPITHFNFPRLMADLHSSTPQETHSRVLYNYHPYGTPTVRRRLQITLSDMLSAVRQSTSRLEENGNQSHIRDMNRWKPWVGHLLETELQVASAQQRLTESSSLPARQEAHLFREMLNDSRSTLSNLPLSHDSIDFFGAEITEDLSKLRNIASARAALGRL